MPGSSKLYPMAPALNGLRGKWHEPTTSICGALPSAAKLRLGNTCTEGQIDGIAGAVEHGCHERSHCSLTPAKLASLSQDARASTGPRAQPEEIQRAVRNRSRQRAWRPAAAAA